MRRFFALAAASVLAAAMLFPINVSGISAQRAIVIDAQSGRVLYEKASNERSLIASTTKIMTALVVCQHCNVLDRVRIPDEAVGIEGSSMYLKAGEVLTVQELLYGLMLHSGNDAAVALAIYCGGTLEGFVEMMNDKARLLGLLNTHFSNPHGLDAENHYSTAEDLAILAVYAMSDPIFAMTVSTKTVKIGERFLRNHNKLLWRVEGADGVKTGYTRAAGRLLVSSATRAGRRLICVTVNAPDDWSDHKTLLEQGFRDYTPKRIVMKGMTLCSIPVAGGEAGRVDLLASESFCYAVTSEERIELELPGSGFVYAPVEAGDFAGYAYVLINGKPAGKIPLEFGETVQLMKEQSRSIFQKIFRIN